MINWNVESSCQNQQCTPKPWTCYEFIENDQRKRAGTRITCWVKISEKDHKDICRWSLGRSPQWWSPLSRRVLCAASLQEPSSQTPPGKSKKHKDIYNNKDSRAWWLLKGRSKQRSAVKNNRSFTFGHHYSLTSIKNLLHRKGSCLSV